VLLTTVTVLKFGRHKIKKITDLDKKTRKLCCRKETARWQMLFLALVTYCVLLRVAITVNDSLLIMWSSLEGIKRCSLSVGVCPTRAYDLLENRTR